MSGFYASANGLRIVEGSLSLPYYGTAVADFSLATDGALASPVVVTIANLTLSMAIEGEAVGNSRQLQYAGRTTVRLVGGAGAWRVPHTLSPYNRPSGVQLSMVLADLAACARNPVSGRAETVKLASGADRSLGLQYVPDPGAPCARILRLLTSGNSVPLWWMDTAGITQVGQTARPSRAITSEARVERYDGGRSQLSVATEDIAAWMPGNTYASPTVPKFTVGHTRIALHEKGDVRLEVIPL